MSISKSRLAIYSIIFLSLLLAFAPVILSDNYLRQDDLIMWQIWHGMRMKDAEFFYYNTVYQLVRPLCMLSFFITDLISITIHNAVYIRLFSVILLGVMGILLYRWQLITNSNRILAATFAICAFTLPPYQIFASTQNYSLILTALLMTFGAVYYWYASYYEITKKHFYFWIGNILFFASLLDYPLSSMYAWALLGIYYLNILPSPDFARRKRFFYFGSLLTFGMMIFYYICIRLVHKFFHVDLGQRAAVINTDDLATRLLGIFDVMTWHSNLWLWKDTSNWKNSPIFGIGVLFAIALIQVNLKKSVRNMREIFKNLLQVLAITFALFFLAYSPIMASPEKQTSFRYAIVTMPILLYIFFWSINVIAITSKRFIYAKANQLVFISFAIFGIGYANYMLGDGIVGPNEHDFVYLNEQITEKVLPLLKQHKPVILHLVDCDGGRNYHYPSDVPRTFEYGMRSCQFQQVPISIVTHILNRIGYASNYNRRNSIIWNNNEIVVNDIPWGNIIINSESNPHITQLKYGVNNTPTLVTIDMREEPVYQHLEFYKHLLGQDV